MTEKVSLRVRVIIAFALGSVFGFGSSVGLSIYSDNSVQRSIDNVSFKIDNQGDKAMTLNTECVAELNKCTGLLIQKDREYKSDEAACGLTRVKLHGCNEINKRLSEENGRIIDYNDDLLKRVEECEE